MPRKKEPIKLLEAKGKTHLTKEEKEVRAAHEIQAPSDNIMPPAFLTVAQKKQFHSTVTDLERVGIISNLDVDMLGIYIQSLDKYREYNKIVNRLLKTAKDNVAFRVVGEDLSRAENLRDKAVKQCRMCASDLGLTITSRCRLVVPQAPEPSKNHFIEKFG